MGRIAINMNILVDKTKSILKYSLRDVLSNIEYNDKKIFIATNNDNDILYIKVSVNLTKDIDDISTLIETNKNLDKLPIIVELVYKYDYKTYRYDNFIDHKRMNLDNLNKYIINNNWEISKYDENLNWK